MAEVTPIIRNPSVEAIDYLRDNPDTLDQFNAHYGSEIPVEAIGVLSDQGDSQAFYDHFFKPRAEVQGELKLREEAETKQFAPELGADVEQEIISTINSLLPDYGTPEPKDVGEATIGGEIAGLTERGLEWMGSATGVLPNPKREAAQAEGYDVNWGTSDQGQRLQKLAAGVPKDSIQFSIPLMLDREFQLQPKEFDYNVHRDENTGGILFTHPLTGRITLFEDPTDIDAEDVITASKEIGAEVGGTVAGTLIGSMAASPHIGAYTGLATGYGLYRGNQLVDLYDQGLLDPKIYKNYSDVLGQVAVDTGVVTGMTLAGDGILNLGRRIFAGKNISDSDLRDLVDKSYTAYEEGTLGVGKDIFGDTPLTAQVAGAYARQRRKMLDDKDPELMTELAAEQRRQWWRNPDKVASEFQDKINRQVSLSENFLQLSEKIAGLGQDKQFMKLYNAGGNVRKKLLDNLAVKLGVEEGNRQALLRHPIFKGSSVARKEWGKKALKAVKSALGGKTKKEAEQDLTSAQTSLNELVDRVESGLVDYGTGQKSLRNALNAQETYLDKNTSAIYQSIQDAIPDDVTFDVAPLANYIQNQIDHLAVKGGGFKDRQIEFLKDQLGKLDSSDFSYEALRNFQSNWSTLRGQVYNDDFGQGSLLTEMNRILREDVMDPGLSKLADKDGSIAELRSMLVDLGNQKDKFRDGIVDKLIGKKGGKIFRTEEDGESLWKNLSKLDPEELNDLRGILDNIHLNPNAGYWEKGEFVPAQDYLPDIMDSLIGQYHKQVLKGNRDKPELIKKKAEDFFYQQDPQGLTNRRLFETFFGKEETDRFASGVSDLSSAVLNRKNRLDTLQKKIKGSKEFSGLDATKPEKFFAATWKPGEITKTEKLFKIFVGADGAPVDSQILDNYRTYIASDLFKNVTGSVKGRSGIQAEFIDPGKLKTYLDGDGKVDGYADQLEVMFGRDFVEGLREIQKASELLSTRATYSGEGGGIAGDAVVQSTEAKAIKDLTRAYVGLFTRAGRMLTAAGRLLERSGKREVNEELLDMKQFHKSMKRNDWFNSAKVRNVTRSMTAAIAGSERQPTKREEDIYELYPGAAKKGAVKRAAPDQDLPTWLDLNTQFPLNEDDPSFKEFRDSPASPKGMQGKDLQNLYNRYRNWRRSERNRQKTDPTRELPARAPRTSAPVSSFGSEDFAPRVAAPAASPTPAAAPMQGGLGAYLPPSMRNPNSMLAQAAQRQQPMMMNEGGFVDPYSNAGVMDWMGMGADAARTAVKYGIPLDANTTLGYQGLMGGEPDTPAQKHMAAYEQLYGNIGKRTVPTDRGSGSLYDRAKNFAGGFDWGHRLGQEGSDDAERMARAYQGKQFLQAKLSNTTPDPERSALMQDAIGDYNENMAGVRAGIASRMADEDMPTIEDLSERAIRWAKNNKRKITIGKGRR